MSHLHNSSHNASSPPSSPVYRSANIERREQRRSTTASSNRTSVLLSERQLNKINQNLANIRHNSLPGGIEPLSPSFKQHPSFMSDMAVATDPMVHSSPNLQTPLLTRTGGMPRSISSGELWTSPNTNTSPSTLPVQTSIGTLPPKKEPTIGVFPGHIQEYAVIEDLLYILMGINGTYIKFEYPSMTGDLDDEDDDPMQDIDSVTSTNTWDSVRYDVDPTLDPSLRHMVEKLLPLATYYMSVDAFVEEFGRFPYGTVNHALCSAIRVFLKEYINFIAQLEHQFQTSSQFTLHRLWFYAQDTLQQMKILHQLALSIRGLGKRSPLMDDDEDNIDAVLEGLKSTTDESNEVIIPDRQKGAAILNVLSERLVGLSGDPKCKQIYSFLLSRASIPYFDILHAWIYRGEIMDPYNEFMVLEKRNVKKENLKEDFNDAYWEMRYTVRDNGLVPGFLEPMKQQILLAGKYLNVVRECGVNIAKPEEMADIMQDGSKTTASTNGQQPFIFHGNGLHGSKNVDLSHVATRNDVWLAVDGGKFIKNLEIAYRYANRTLLNLLLKEQQLTARLRSIKHYFFLDQSDFLTSFLDLAKDELKKSAQDIPLARLQSLMDIVLRNSSSVAAYDPFKEDVVVALSPLKMIDELLRIISVDGMKTPLDSSGIFGQDGISGLSSSAYLLDRSQSLSSSMVLSGNSNAPAKDALNGYDALTLDYTVTFPLSLVISRKALTKYQLLFRHLLYLKHVEDLLCKTWIDQKGSVWRRKSSCPQTEHWKSRVHSLRNRMLSFVQQFTYYVTNEVLEPNWQQLESNLTKVSTVDEVLQYHSDFLDNCLKQCMLTNSKLLRIYNKLMAYCVKFSHQAERYTQLLEAKQEAGISKPGLDPETNTNTQFESAQRLLTKMEETIRYHMKLLIDALNFYSATETVQFLCLVARLDYNTFYKDP
ncbi:Spc98 family-domain-containing protein [Chlamydoabsidia padenii]|nr:Spc98 family-domain-containing protein [Chlamydoabsidia padenii]